MQGRVFLARCARGTRQDSSPTIKPERVMGLEGAGSVLCPSALQTSGPTLSLLQAELEKRWQDVGREEYGGNTCFYRSVSITAFVRGACLRDTFVSALISPFEPERLNG